jgi:hypothetical protein
MFCGSSHRLWLRPPTFATMGCRAKLSTALGLRSCASSRSDLVFQMACDRHLCRTIRKPLFCPFVCSCASLLTNCYWGKYNTSIRVRQMPRVQGFQFTNATKAEIVERLALAFERHEIEIINDPVLLAELQAFESDRTPSGSTRYGAPEGCHDDCVMALALAWSVAAPSRTNSAVGMFAR